MSKSYGRCVGCQQALDWLASLQVPDSEKETKEYVLNRMRYEFDKDIPVEPKFHKGKYGHQYDSYSCGNCGHGISTGYKFCPECGFRITDNYLGRRKTAAEQAGHFADAGTMMPAT